MIKTPCKVPSATVSQSIDGEIKPLKTDSLFADGINVLIGLPGAFTPVCTYNHIPDLIKHANAIKSLGIKNIYCISDDNLWALDAWAESFEDNHKIQFLSDGNRDFLDQIDIRCSDEDLFLNKKYGRFYAIIDDGQIVDFKCEVSVMVTIYTEGEAIIKAIKKYSDSKHAQ